MKKNAKRFADMLLVLAMLLSLSVTAFAADYAMAPVTTDSVTIVLQMRNEAGTVSNIVIPGTTTDAYTIKLSDLPANPTVMDAVNKLPNLTPVAENPVGSGEPADCTWKRVENYAYNPETGMYEPTGTYSYALNSLAFEDEDAGEEVAYTSRVLVSTAHAYEGWAWTYAVNGAEPGTYMSQYSLAAGMNITLTFGYSSMEF